jgi:hypothetical protein
MTSLYDPIILGDMNLRNRVFMAPLTRNRATPDGVPGQWAATYYSQRASAGLIVTEATQISPMGKGYINTPGIHSHQQIAGWKPIVDAVHRSGGRIFLQLWHVGRISHSSLLPDFASPVAPSAIRARSQTVVESGFVDVSEPRALSLPEIQSTVEDYGRGAANAKAAGFDGVEIHAANGYLIDQFLRSNSNVRTDAYGGSAANRVRFLGEVVEAVLGVWERTRVGVRIHYPALGSIASSACTCFSSASRMSSGQGMERWLAVDVATTVCRAFQRIPSAPETTWAKRRDVRPTWRTHKSNVSRSPKTDGREKSQFRWTVGVPIFRTAINSCQGKPMSAQNSSTTPLRMFRYEGKYAIPEGSQSPNLISRLAENIRTSRVMGALSNYVRPPRKSVPPSINAPALVTTGVGASFCSVRLCRRASDTR